MTVSIKSIAGHVISHYDDLLPEEPLLRAEASISLMTPYLRPVEIRDKLLSSRHIRLVKVLPPGHLDDPQ